MFLFSSRYYCYHYTNTDPFDEKNVVECDPAPFESNCTLSKVRVKIWVLLITPLEIICLSILTDLILGSTAKVTTMVSSSGLETPKFSPSPTESPPPGRIHSLDLIIMVLLPLISC